MFKILKVLMLPLAIATTLLALYEYKYPSTRQTDRTDYTSPDEQKILEKLLKHSNTPEYKYQLINSYPHDTHAFTEGLLIDNGYLYESSGLYGKSYLSITYLPDGNIKRKYSLPKQYFAEGITILDNSLYQLSYHEKTGFVYDKSTFKLKQTFEYPTEGWGLTTDGKELIMSNGTDTLYFINPKTFKPSHSLLVIDQDHHRINSLNELEYINGKLFANVWPTNIILIISPQTGIVVGWFNIEALKPRGNYLTTDSVANGIAYDNKNNLIFVTGKNWPYLYTIKIK